MKTQKSRRLDVSKLTIREILPKVQLIESIDAFKETDEIEAKFYIELGPSFSLENNLIKIELSIAIDLKHANQEYKKAGNLIFEFLYSYEKLEDLLIEEGIPGPEVFVTCANISYSTLRGIIYAKAANTCLNNVLLPIIKGDELMKSLKA